VLGGHLILLVTADLGPFKFSAIESHSFHFCEKTQNQRTAGFGYFKTLRKHVVFMKEPTVTKAVIGFCQKKLKPWISLSLSLYIYISENQFFYDLN